MNVSLLGRNVKFKFLLVKPSFKLKQQFYETVNNDFLLLKIPYRKSKKFCAKMIATKCDFFTFACKKKERHDLLQNVLHRFDSVFFSAEVIRSSSWYLEALRMTTVFTTSMLEFERWIIILWLCKRFRMNWFITSSFGMKLAELAIGLRVKPLTIE